MPLGAIGLTTYRWSNARKSWLLLGLYPLIILILLWWQIYFICLFLYNGHGPAAIEQIADEYYFKWGWIALVALAGWLWYVWSHHASIIRGLCMSRPLNPEEHPSLQALIDAVCISQGIASPEIEIIDTPSRNSFVTALGPDDTYRLFLTQGLLDSLERDELEAVIAHEVAHIINDDTYLLSISIAFTDLYPLLIQSQIKPRLTESPAEAESRRPSLALLMLAYPLNFILLMPLAVAFFLLSLLRVFLFMRREFDADAVAIEITKNPDALMRALLRISRRARLPYGTQDIRFLCIDNPRGGFFSTHPRISARVAAISEISGTPIPEIEASTSASPHKRFQENYLLRRVFKKKDETMPKPFNAPWK